MDDRLQKSLYYLGVIAALYIFFRYLLPFIFKALGFAFKAVFLVFMWAAIAFVVALLVVHIIKIIRKESE